MSHAGGDYYHDACLFSDTATAPAVRSASVYVSGGNGKSNWNRLFRIALLDFVSVCYLLYFVTLFFFFVLCNVLYGCFVRHARFRIII